MKKICILLAATGLVTASMSVTQAQPYYISGSGQTPTWAPGTPANEMTGGPTVYTLTTPTVANTYNEFKVTGATWGDPNYPGSNAKINGDANGSNTYYFYPGTSGDGWFPAANRVGYENPGNAWGLAGDFTTPTWDDDATALMTTNLSGVFSVTYNVASVGTHSFKFKTVGTWDGAVGQDFGSGSANIAFATVTPNQSVEFLFDPIRGRYLINIPPVTNQVVFAVDMSSQIQLGQFHPGYSVYAAGTFNGWPNPGTGLGLLLTNDPPYNGGSNTNIYYGTNELVGLPGSSAAEFKFNQNDPAAVNTGWETSNNRSVTLLTTNGTLLLPVVTFSDAYASDYLAVPTPVFFSVDMATAVGTDAHVFDPNNDNVYINGQFINWYDWSGGINPVSAPAGYQMIRSNTSTIYTNTITFPAGMSVSFIYKYGMDPGAANGGPLDDEAGYGVNHSRVVRNTAFDPYPLATDTFGNMYAEPFFNNGSTAGGNLTIGSVSGGTIPVQWLGRPGAQLQWSTNLTGNWQTLTNTDGSTWVTGDQSTNGFASRTNWPATGENVFFRLVKPN